jgi:hypothetical protein
VGFLPEVHGKGDGRPDRAVIGVDHAVGEGASRVELALAAVTQDIDKRLAGEFVGVDRVHALAGEHLVGEQRMILRVGVPEGVLGIEGEALVDGGDAFRGDCRMAGVEPAHQAAGTLGVAVDQGVEGCRRDAIRPPVGPVAAVGGDVGHGPFQVTEEVDQGGGANVHPVAVPFVPLPEEFAVLVSGGSVVGVDRVPHEGQEIVRVTPGLEVGERGEQLALGHGDILDVLPAMAWRKFQARESEFRVGRVIAHQAKDIGAVIGQAVPDQDTASRGGFPVEGGERAAEGRAAVVGVDVGGQVTDTGFRQDIAVSPGKSVDVAAHARFELQALARGEALGRLEGRAKEVHVQQFGQVEVPGGEFHQTGLEGAAQPAALRGAGGAEELFQGPEIPRWCSGTGGPDAAVSGRDSAPSPPPAGRTADGNRRSPPAGRCTRCRCASAG